MGKKFFILGVIFISSCISIQKDPRSFSTTSFSNLYDEKAITWIENNLTSAHSLKNHVSRKSIPEIMSEYNIPGVSMVFVDKGKVAWKKTYGYADLEKSEKVTERTVFTGASLSKPLTAMAALNLVEAGKITLDENVNYKLKGWQVPENEFTKQEKVTLRHLISHRAGIRNDLWTSYLPGEKVPSLTQLLAGQTPSVDPAVSVIAVPGLEEKYSNPGYSIIQKILEDLTGDSFENAMNKLVLQQSGMKESSFQQPMPDYLRKRKAIGYDKELNPYSYKIFPYKAAGGVWTTPSDIAKFIITLFEDYEGLHNILSSSMMKKVFSRNRIRLGFSKIFNESSVDLIFRHYGSNQGFTCYVVGSLLKRQAIIIMTNSDNGFDLLDYIARAVAEYYRWDFLQPTIHFPYTTKVSSLEEYIGNFRYKEEKIAFNVNDKFLTVKPETSDIPVRLTPIGQSEFISIDNSTKYTFLHPRGNRSGPIRWVRITSAASGSDYYAEKIYHH